MARARNTSASARRRDLEYHAAYYHGDDSKWIVAEVLDFPGALSQGRTLQSARRLIRDALRLLAECMVERGEALPQPNPKAKDKSAFYRETIRLRIRALTGAAT
jgi:predicted RNase H-like HicB family nuclease